MRALEISLHDVKSITLRRRFLSNSMSRTMLIEMEDGNKFQLILYGKTGKLEMLPKHKDFYDADA